MSTSLQNTDKAILLDKLTIQRAPATDHKSRGSALLLVSLTVVFLAAALWFWFSASAAKRKSILNPAVAPLVESKRLVESATPTSFPDHEVSEAETITSILDATGYVVARQAATVSSKTTGKVVAVLIEEGMAVQKGDLIARLDDSAAQAQLALSIAELHAAKARALELKALIRSKQLDVERARALVRKQLVSQSNYDAVVADLDTLLAQSDTAGQAVTVSERRVAIYRVAIADLQIRAPFSGVVINKSAQPGEMISPVSAGGGFTRTGIGTIVDMKSLEIQVDVNETYINRVSPNQPVNIKLNAYPELTYKGRVLAVIPTADRNKATIRVRVRFVAADEKVLPEMGVRVAFLEL